MWEQARLANVSKSDDGTASVYTTKHHRRRHSHLNQRSNAFVSSRLSTGLAT